MNLNVSMEITCPNCNQVNQMEGRPVGNEGRLKTICPCCLFQFHLERETDTRLKVRTSGVFDLAQALGEINADEMDWMVDSGFSKGFCYDVKGLASLIRSGLLTPDTRVKPPGTTLSIEAKQIVQLKPFFEEMASGRTNQDLLTDLTLETNMCETDLDWFQFEDSRYFEKDILPHLQSGQGYQIV